MKRTGLRRTAALALALILSVGTCFAGCGEKLRETGGVIKTQDGQKTYRHASTTYEAVEVGKKVGTLTDTGGGSGTVYAIEGLSADEWLVTEEGYVLYADGVHLPTLTEMKPDAVQVCAYRQSIHVLRTVTGADILPDAVRAYTEGENIEYLGLEAQHSYKLRFTSAAYPALYFSLLYIEYGEDMVLDGVNYGRYFLRGVFDGRFVAVGDGLHQLMFGGETTETASETASQPENSGNGG